MERSAHRSPRRRQKPSPKLCLLEEKTLLAVTERQEGKRKGLVVPGTQNRGGNRVVNTSKAHRAGRSSPFSKNFRQHSQEHKGQLIPHLVPPKIHPPRGTERALGTLAQLSQKIQVSASISARWKAQNDYRYLMWSFQSQLINLHFFRIGKLRTIELKAMGLEHAVRSHRSQKGSWERFPQSPSPESSPISAPPHPQGGQLVFIICI